MRYRFLLHRIIRIILLLSFNLNIKERNLSIVFAYFGCQLNKSILMEYGGSHNFPSRNVE